MHVLLLALLAGQVSGSGADGGVEPAVIYTIRKPTLVPPGRYMSEESFKVIDDEMKRLQYVEAHPPAVETQGYLIGIFVAGGVCLAGGMALGFYLGRQ